MLTLSRKQARRLAIGAQLLSGPPPRRPTKRKMLDVIRHLGAVQIDTINVVARSHHIVLWSRLGNHPPEWLHELLAKDRAIFEYWVHAAAYAPTELFPYFRRSMLEFPQNGRSRAKEWVRENQDVLDMVASYARQNGAVSSITFDPPEGAGRAEAWAWYGNKPTNVALEVLWTQGVLMVDRRENFRRIYDLTERVYPDWSDDELPSIDEEQDVLGEAALNAMGLTTVRWLPDYFRTDWARRALQTGVARQILDRLVERGVGIPARVEGIEDDVIVSARALEKRFKPSRTTLLSPFDSLVWDRRRTRELFDFYLQLEAYTPAHKREYGYFCLPILYRDQLVGRLDPKVDRKSGVLSVKALHLEPWFAGSDDDRFYSELAASLNDFRTFNNATDIEVVESDPDHAAAQLRDAIHKLT